MTPFETWQLATYGNFIPESGEAEMENGTFDKEANDKWVDDNAAMNLIEQEF